MLFILLGTPVFILIGATAIRWTLYCKDNPVRRAQIQMNLITILFATAVIAVHLYKNQPTTKIELALAMFKIPFLTFLTFIGSVIGLTWRLTTTSSNPLPSWLYVLIGILSAFLAGFLSQIGVIIYCLLHANFVGP